MLPKLLDKISTVAINIFFIFSEFIIQKNLKPTIIQFSKYNVYIIETPLVEFFITKKITSSAPHFWCTRGFFTKRGADSLKNKLLQMPELHKPFLWWDTALTSVSLVFERLIPKRPPHSTSDVIIYAVIFGILVFISHFLVHKNTSLNWMSFLNKRVEKSLLGSGAISFLCENESLV